MHTNASNDADAIQDAGEADKAVALRSHMKCVSTNGTAFIVAVYKMQQKEKGFQLPALLLCQCMRHVPNSGQDIPL